METDKDIIYEITSKFSDNNIYSIIEWVIKYDLEELYEENRTILSKRAEVLKELIIKYISGVNKEITSDILFERYQSDLMEYITCSQRANFELAFSKNDLNKVLELILEITSEFNYADYDIEIHEKYKEKYYLETSVLLDRLIEIFEKEYTKRIEKIKSSLIEYITPHSIAIKKLRGKITEIESALKHLIIEKTSLGTDADVIKKALEDKLYDMRKIEEKEIINMKNVDTYISYIKIAKKEYSEILNALYKTREKLQMRNKYISLLNDIDSDIPVLENIFSDLSDSFNINSTTIKDSILILNLAMNNSILKSIEKQKTLNLILGSEKVKYSENNFERDDSLEYEINIDDIERL